MRGAVAVAFLAVAVLAGTLAFGLGTLPWVAGALALLGAAWWAAARRRGAAGAILAVTALLVCAGLVAAPRALIAAGNGTGIAWSFPGDEQLVLAEAGMAVTTDGGRQLVGRRVADGRIRWRSQLPAALLGGQPPGWQRVGRTLVVTAGDGAIAAVDLGNGRVLWEASEPVGARVAAVASPSTVASTLCDFSGEGRPRCRVEAHDLETGRVRWRAPVAPWGQFLGAPTGHDANYSRGPLWPSRHAVVVPPGPNQPYANDPVPFTVRALDTGRIVRRDALAPHEAAVLAGDALLRATAAGGATKLRLVERDRLRGRRRRPRPLDRTARRLGRAVRRLGLVVLPRGRRSRAARRARPSHRAPLAG
jgi:hypothetical protein